MVKINDNNELNKVERKYYENINSKMVSYIFNKKAFPYNSNFYRFLILDLENIDSDIKSNVIKFINELIGDAEVVELKNKIVFFYINNLDIDFYNIFDSINYDFSIKMKAFVSGKINIDIRDAFIILFNLYLKLSANLSRLYTSNRELILDIVTYDYNLLKEIKKIILNKVYDDNLLQKLIFSMFDNNLNVTKTAKDIYMHRNSINYKINTIKVETSLNIQNFKDAISMYWIINAK